MRIVKKISGNVLTKITSPRKRFVEDDVVLLQDDLGNPQWE